MSKVNLNMVEKAFSVDEIAQFETSVKVIESCQSAADGLAEAIAGQLYIINKKELFKIDNYTSMVEFAMDRFNISRGTVSDSINTYDRFGDKNQIGQLAEKYQDYRFSTLISLKKFTDEELDAIGINPTMTRAQCKEAIKKHEQLKIEEKERPSIESQLTNTCLALNAYMDKEQVKDLRDSFLPEGKTVAEASVEELKTVNEGLTQKLQDMFETQIKQETSETSGESEECSTIEHPEEQIRAEGEVDESYEVYPTEKINIIDYYKNGKLDKKRLLDNIWEAIEQGVDKYEFDLIITKENIDGVKMRKG